jgi:hypothetical protein
MAHWNRFFSIAGDPKELYQRSVDCGAYNVATSYLIIIQTLEPIEVSWKLALHLLEHTLNAEDFDTGSELYRFLKSVYDAESIIDKGKNSFESFSNLNTEESTHMVLFRLIIVVF